MKKILLLGGSRFLLPVIREAKALGCHTITCDYLPDNIAHRYSDEYHNVSITDLEATLRLARELKVDGSACPMSAPMNRSVFCRTRGGFAPSCGSTGFRSPRHKALTASTRRSAERNSFAIR